MIRRFRHPLLSAFAFLSLAAAIARAQTGELMVIKETGPRDKRVNMVILGDGYTAADKDKFKSQLQTTVDGVLKDPPLADYADYFNVYAIFVASNQTGADNSAPGVTRDTYYNANYVNGSRLLVIDDQKGMAVINKYLPEADMQFAVVNSETYGGSGGPIAVANYTSPEIIAHEAQHSFSALGDEYDYEGIDPWEAPNTTQATARKDIRWTHWIDAATPVPTPETQAYAKVPGLFEGAAYNATGWYRPKQNCRMRENGIPFCEVCMEAIILSLYDHVSPLDSALPKNAAVAVAANQVPPLRIKIKKPLFHDLTVAWSVDGIVQKDVIGPAFTKTLAAGTHKVSVFVNDTTHYVRKDPKGLLNDSAAWQVTVTVATGIPAAGTRPGPELLQADARQLLVRVPGPQSYRLRLTSADGLVLEDRSWNGTAAGTARIAWSRTLAPGLYLAELERKGSLVRKRFLIAP